MDLASSAVSAVVNMVSSGSTGVPPPPPPPGASGSGGGDGGSSTSDDSYTGSSSEMSESEIDEAVLQELEAVGLSEKLSDRLKKQFEKVKRNISKRALPASNRRKKRKERSDRLEQRINDKIVKLESKMRFLDEYSQKLEKQQENKMRGKKNSVRMPVPEFGIPANADVVLPAGQERKTPAYTLAECMRHKMLDSAFPKNRFNGETGMGVREFLEAMNRGQKTCLLTEEDFKEVLVIKCIGGPYNMVSNWISMGNSVDYIYQNLYSIYNKDLPPDEAQNQCTVYKPTRGWKLSKIMAHIEDLARQACCNIEDPVKRNDYYNNIAVMALSRAFPPNGTRYIQEEKARIFGETGAQPTYSQLCVGLTAMEEPINYELEHPPPQFQFAKSSKTTTKIGSEHINKNTSGHHKGKYHKNSRVNQITTHESEEEDAVHVNALESQPGSSKPRNSGKYNNKAGGYSGSGARVAGGRPYCNMCGRYDHTPSDKCTSMRDDRGKIVVATMSTGPCQICRERLSCDLYHNEKFCHVRDGMIELYRIGEVTPVGKAASYVYNLPWFKSSRKNGKKEENQGSNRGNNSNRGNYNSNRSSNRNNDSKDYKKSSSHNSKGRNGSGQQRRNDQ